MRNPKSFAKGSAVKIFEAFDCENCEVKKKEPLYENENILELYNAFPHNFDDSTGLRIFDANAIRFLFEVYDVSPNMQDDYYKRLLYFHGELSRVTNEKQKKKRAEEEQMRKRKSRLSKRRN